MSYIPTAQPNQGMQMQTVQMPQININMFNAFYGILNQLLTNYAANIPQGAADAIRYSLNLNNQNLQERLSAYQNAQTFMTQVHNDYARSVQGFNGAQYQTAYLTQIISAWLNVKIEQISSGMAVQSLSTVNNGGAMGGIITQGPVAGASGGDGLFNFDDGFSQPQAQPQQADQSNGVLHMQTPEPISHETTVQYYHGPTEVQPTNQGPVSHQVDRHAETTMVIEPNLEPASVENFIKENSIVEDGFKILEISTGSVAPNAPVTTGVLEILPPCRTADQAIAYAAAGVEAISRHSEYMIGIKYQQPQTLDCRTSAWNQFCTDMLETIAHAAATGPRGRPLNVWRTLNEGMDNTNRRIGEEFERLAVASINDLLLTRFRYSATLSDYVRIGELSDVDELCSGRGIGERLRAFPKWSEMIDDLVTEAVCRVLMAPTVTADEKDQNDAIRCILIQDDITYTSGKFSKYDVVAMSAEERAAMVSEVLARKTIILVDHITMVTNVLAQDDLREGYLYPRAPLCANQQLFWKIFNSAGLPAVRHTTATVQVEEAQLPKRGFIDRVRFYTDERVSDPTHLIGEMFYLTTLVLGSNGAAGAHESWKNRDGFVGRLTT